MGLEGVAARWRQRMCEGAAAERAPLLSVEPEVAP